MFYSRFWTNAMRAIGYGAGISWLHELYLSHSKLIESSNRHATLLPKVDPLYQIAERAFSDMGADLTRHPLELSVFDSSRHTSFQADCSSATVHRNLMSGAYRLQVDLDAFNRYKRRTVEGQHISQDKFFRAIFAHEAVHAIEYHNFFKIYMPLLLTLPALYSVDAMRVRLPWMSGFGPLSLFFLVSYFGQQFELRSDRLAAEHDPEIRGSLISIFSATGEGHDATHHSGSSFRFFHSHPSCETRLDAIQGHSPIE